MQEKRKKHIISQPLWKNLQKLFSSQFYIKKIFIKNKGWQNSYNEYENKFLVFIRNKVLVFIGFKYVIFLFIYLFIYLFIIF